MSHGLRLSPVGSVLVEESVLGWKEFELEVIRDQARRVISAVGVETGGSNGQFAVDPASGRVLVIEMNPRVSRSSALASKATGFPIAKIAALLAAGYTLDELCNDITRETSAAFEPSLDSNSKYDPGRWGKRGS